MIRGTHEPLQLSSNSGGSSCTDLEWAILHNACAMDEERDSSFSITFSKDGCDPQTVSVFPTLAGAGVILGGIIDYGTGAVYSLRPNPVVTTLKCRAIASAAVAQPAAIPAVNVTAPQSPGSAGAPINGDWQRAQ
jgi:hypothetical protein